MTEELKIIFFETFNNSSSIKKSSINDYEIQKSPSITQSKNKAFLHLNED